MNEKKISGTVKTENVIWFVVASLLIGFVSGVAFGIYKSGTIADPHQSQASAAMDEQRQKTIGKSWVYHIMSIDPCNTNF